MKFDLSGIEMSKWDVSRGVKLPETLTEDLAEFIGIMIGDGHLGYYIRDYSTLRLTANYQICIAGNKKEKKYLEYVMNLFSSLFRIKLCYTEDPRSNSVVLRKDSKGILQFLNKLCEVPLNKKTNIVKIPRIIKDSDERIKCTFLRGLADADFTLTFKNRTNKGHNYPHIKAGFKSNALVKDIEKIYSQLGFKYCVVYDEKGYDNRNGRYQIIHSIYLNGRDNFKKWIEKIGFSNPKFQRKVDKWLEEGICPPGF